MNTDEKNIVCIACSIFKRELQALQEKGQLSFPVRYLDSMLHMKPEQLRDQLTALVDEELQQGRRVILIYGDCQSHMIDLAEKPGVVRTEGINCVEIFLGSQRYRQLRAEGVFFLLPEWAMRWKEIFQNELGLNEDNAKDIMTGMHKKLIYLDTGVFPVPEDHLRALSQYCGLPWSILRTSHEYLLHSILQAAEKLKCIQAQDE